MGLSERIQSLNNSKANPHLSNASLMTSAQEQAFIRWQEDAIRAKARKAEQRRKAKASRQRAQSKLPERLAAQQTLIDANGGRLPPRWRYELQPTSVEGKTEVQPKRVANRPAFISTYPYDPEIDGPTIGLRLAKAAERQARIDRGFKLSEDIVLSGCLVRSGLKFEGFKSEALGTKSALRWPALVHRSRNMRVSWHHAAHSDASLSLARARMEGTPEWLLTDYEDDVAAAADQRGSEVSSYEDFSRALEPAHFKVLGLDAPTVEGNKTLLGFLRLDTDLVWRSTEHLMEALAEKVRRGKIKSLPNFVVGIQTDDGKLVRPHLIWLLPIDGGVLNRDNKFLRLFKAVYYGLCNALADLGADPQAPATSQLVKNPLSPLYQTHCLSDEWPSLREHAACLDMGLDRAALVRKSVATVTGEEFRHSNEFFNGCLDAARGMMARWHHEHDPIYVEAQANKDHGLLIDSVQEALSALVASTGMTERSMEYARHKVASWVVEKWDPTKVGGRQTSSGGRLAHLVSGICGVRERQAFAGRYTASVRADRTLERLVEAWDTCKAETGATPSKTSLAKAAGVSRQTVHNRFEELQEALGQAGVKDALMLYREGESASREKRISATRQSSNICKPSTLNPAASSLLDKLDVANDNDCDDLELAEHEAWIAFQEDRPCRAHVADVLDSMPTSSHPTSATVWQRYSGTPNAFDEDEYIVCPPDKVYVAIEKAKAA